MNRKKTYVLVFIVLSLALILLSFVIDSGKTTEKSLSSSARIEVFDQYEASESIEFKFDRETPIELQESAWMYLSSSYGSTLISPKWVDQQWLFKVPSEISKKSGYVLWKLFDHDRNSLDEGTFHIKPNPITAPIIESYLGPPTIMAGELDFSMMVIAATDTYDNLVPNETPITIQTYVNKLAHSYKKTTNDRITWERIFSPRKSGRMLISGTSNLASTSEKTLDIIPNNATNFSLKERLVHPYADGNQIAVFTTSEIKDEFGNTISDGTLVHFVATTSNEEKMQVSGTTINGIATGQFLHPISPHSWKVEALIFGLAKSEEIDVSFLSVVRELAIQFSENNRTIVIGPITSYMGQLIPDGAEVVLYISNKKNILTSRNGMVTFELNPAIYQNGPVTMKVETMGISKTFEKTIN